MTLLDDELEANFKGFHADWTKQASTNWADLSKHKHYKESYRRLSALQALKINLVDANFSSGSAAFFIEAHNDAVVSHVSASMGAWRAALQALRSCLENTLCAIFYKDHPIELRLWEDGKFRTGFTELLRYAEHHPDIEKLGKDVTGLAFIEEEYATLSKAVHGSAVQFRMTDSASKILLWSTEAAKVGKWASREQKVIEGISLLMVCLFADKLKATSLPSLREILGYSISKSKSDDLKKKLNITINKINA